MRSMILLVTLFIFVLPFSSAGQKQTSPAKQNAAAFEKAKYVGLKYRESLLPAGLKEGYENTIIGESENYALQVIISGKLKMLWLERIISRNPEPSGKRNFEVEVKDVVLLPTMTRRQILTFDKCYVGKRPYPPEQYIGVIVQPFSRQTTEFYRPLKAWRANLKTEKLEEISTKGVRCTPQDVDEE
jgi:hypothetical protein